MNNTPQNPVSWFAINVQDLVRAARFYETVFGLPLQEVPGKNPQHKMYLFTPAWEQHGIGGMLWHAPAAQPAGQGGITVFFNCADCTETARAAEAAGGKILTAKFPIANGFAAFIEDSEGNRIGLHSPA